MADDRLSFLKFRPGVLRRTSLAPVSKVAPGRSNVKSSRAVAYSKPRSCRFRITAPGSRACLHALPGQAAELALRDGTGHPLRTTGPERVVRPSPGSFPRRAILPTSCCPPDFACRQAGQRKVISQALELGAVEGLGHRKSSAILDNPESTVRDCLRTFKANAPAVTEVVAARVHRAIAEAVMSCFFNCSCAQWQARTMSFSCGPMRWCSSVKVSMRHCFSWPRKARFRQCQTRPVHGREGLGWARCAGRGTWPGHRIRGTTECVRARWFFGFSWGCGQHIHAKVANAARGHDASDNISTGNNYLDMVATRNCDSLTVAPISFADPSRNAEQKAGAIR